MRSASHREPQWVAIGLPAALLALLLGASGLRSGAIQATRPGPEGRATPLAAGLTSLRADVQAGDYDGVHSSRRQLGSGRELGIRVPVHSAGGVDERSHAEGVITISKPGARHEIDFDAGRRQWKYLSRQVRSRIDEAQSGPGRWRCVVVHCSATGSGDARALAYHHRNVRKLPQGLSYHFVIGNGTWSGDGEIEVGERWIRQESGAGWPESSPEGRAIEICLVGDFESHDVGRAQLEAFDELTDYLRARFGEIPLKTHSGLEDSPRSCPGRFFPSYLLEP